MTPKAGIKELPPPTFRYFPASKKTCHAGKRHGEDTANCFPGSAIEWKWKLTTLRIGIITGAYVSGSRRRFFNCFFTASLSDNPLLYSFSVTTNCRPLSSIDTFHVWVIKSCTRNIHTSMYMQKKVHPIFSVEIFMSVLFYFCLFFTSRDNRRPFFFVLFFPNREVMGLLISYFMAAWLDRCLTEFYFVKR